MGGLVGDENNETNEAKHRTTTVAESHGAVIPPHIKPIVYATVLQITRS